MIEWNLDYSNINFELILNFILYIKQLTINIKLFVGKIKYKNKI